MTPLSFLQLNQGKWITQRTIYKVYTNEIYHYKSEIIIDSNDKQQIFNNSYLDNLLHVKLVLCVQNKFDLNNFGISIESCNNSGPTNLIHKQYPSSKNFLYIYANNHWHICIKNLVNDIVNFEKIWFVNSNLRLSISLIQKNNRCIITSFSSDIRIC